MKKRILSLFLALSLALGMALPTAAAGETGIAWDELRSSCGDCLPAEVDPTVDYESDAPYVPENAI